MTVFSALLLCIALELAPVIVLALLWFVVVFWLPKIVLMIGIATDAIVPIPWSSPAPDVRMLARLILCPFSCNDKGPARRPDLCHREVI